MGRKIIFDTDIGCDCDDAAALAVALELMNVGECELLAVTSCTACVGAAGCIEAILSYYGHPEIPVGSFDEKEGLLPNEWHDVYASDTALRYDTRYKRGEEYENTVRLLRKTLSETKEKVTIVATGALTSLAKLLQSGPDECSELTGTELVRQKVETTVCMAGRFFEAWREPMVTKDRYREEPEWNVKCDIKAAQIVCDLWPSELIFCSFEIGAKIITCKDLQIRGPVNNPVRTCFTYFSGREGGGSIGRETWDGATMLYAIRPDAEYWELHPYGRIQVDDAGVTSWHGEAGSRQTFFVEKMPCKEVEDIIEEILNRDIAREN